MSVNKGVAAAQRRRTTTQEPPRQRMPQPSINSSQMFGNNASGPPQPGRPGQQQQQQQHPDETEGIAGISKMTIPQAITLITLRLGQTETRMQHLYKLQYEQGHNVNNSGEGHENMILVDKEVIHSITQRLDELDQRIPELNTDNSQAISSTDITLLKQQFETVKHVTTQNKISMNSISKDYKQSIATVRKELAELKTQLSELQILMFDTSKQVLSLSLGHVEEDNEITNIDKDEDENEDEDVDVESSVISNSNFQTLLEEGIIGDQ